MIENTCGPVSGICWEVLQGDISLNQHLDLLKRRTGTWLTALAPWDHNELLVVLSWSCGYEYFLAGRSTTLPVSNTARSNVPVQVGGYLIKKSSALVVRKD